MWYLYSYIGSYSNLLSLKTWGLLVRVQYTKCQLFKEPETTVFGALKIWLWIRTFHDCPRFQHQNLSDTVGSSTTQTKSTEPPKLHLKMFGRGCANQTSPGPCLPLQSNPMSHSDPGEARQDAVADTVHAAVGAQIFQATAAGVVHLPWHGAP